jgi:phosphopantothenoylcysteine synthetase/decarboxylase
MLLLGVTGSIAAYKAVDLASKMSQEGLEVSVLMTPMAEKFVSPLSFEAVTGRPVTTEASWFQFPMAHIRLTEAAKLFLIAPLSANTLAALAHGLAGNVLTSSALAVNCPLWLAPAMNTRMWEHPATRENVELLRERRHRFLEPQEGPLACGDQGVGRMMEVAEIIQEVRGSGLL